MSARFSNPFLRVPPGGFVLTIDGETVRSSVYLQFVERAYGLMQKHGVSGDPGGLAAEQMCPKLGPLARVYCTGSYKGGEAPLPAETLASSLVFCSRPVVAFDRIEARAARCLKCPKHKRPWCTSCNGHLARMMTAFGKRRPELPVDRGLGICMCARAYETVLCSVEYKANEPIWAGVPPECWRNNDV